MLVAALAELCGHGGDLPSNLYLARWSDVLENKVALLESCKPFLLWGTCDMAGSGQSSQLDHSSICSCLLCLCIFLCLNG